ncbi:hypothetical protein NEOLEDRAFT_1077005 [Neolentinus lepideus HHB14362 ss-1]|uniref:DUF6533 domain-containing protein n=1 Tax=Neolentinus lepideus HHB14362 ss-1 TaxID=1314782 RepID=A0A165NMI3_9AGAM|nr:hypothetical protein NEOLEDRAFT_1077005 [Neolentinus lepideus HHB14362 ss-1]
MSSKAIKAAYTHYLQFRIQYASIALLYYDYALTFPREVKYIWRSRFRLSTILYIFCRYALLANVLYLLAVAGKLHQRVCVHKIMHVWICNTWYKFIGAISVLGRAAVIGVFTLRAYAVYSRNRLVLAYLGTVGAVCVALDITHVPGLRCVGSSTNELLSILMVVFEFSSAILTTIRSVQALKGNGLTWKEQKTGFFYLILEQGTIWLPAFFSRSPLIEGCTKGRSVLSVFTMGAVILNFTGLFQRLLNALTLPLSGLLTARFILHLRRWERDSDAVVSGSKSTPGNERNHELSEFEAVRRTITSLVDDFGEDPVVRERRRDALPVELEPVASQSRDKDEDAGEMFTSVKEGKRRAVV